MNLFKKILEFIGNEDLTLEEVLPINYNYNNYDGMNPIIISNKSKLKKLRNKKKITYKQYSDICSKMKSGWKNKSLLEAL